MPKAINEIGNRYGRLVVIYRDGSHRFPNGKSVPTWKCRCDCGATAVVIGHNLRHSHTTSCGCLARESLQDRSRTHGMSGTSEHRTWLGMRERCKNSKNPKYKDYGGRVIKVCERWQRFEAFYADMGPKPSPTHSIDRINNDGDYEPDNCRWATAKEQDRNRRTNIRLASGVLAIEAAECADISISKVRQRLRRGWNEAEAIKGKPITSRAGAKAAGKVRYFTGVPCIRGHISVRSTKTGDCFECRREKRRRGNHKPLPSSRQRRTARNPPNIASASSNDVGRR